MNKPLYTRPSYIHQFKKLPTQKLGVWQESTHALEQLAPKMRRPYCMQTIETLLDGKLLGLSVQSNSQYNSPTTSNFTSKVSVDEP
jgi:hypothetical protein